MPRLAEDRRREAWRRWSRVGPDTVDDAEGYLVRVTVRLAIDRLRRTRRESYVGPWPPEPLLTGQDAAEDGLLAESSGERNRVPESRSAVLGALMAAGAFGLLVGFAVPVLGTLAVASLTLHPMR